MRWLRLIVPVLGVAVLPTVVYAQASIAGTAKDSSGGVLPGVAVEASSPALIEKSRSVVTDSSGEYRIVDLRPGTYTVTFMLSGFATVKREGIELSGTFTATVNAEMRVGSVAETVTVTGESPLVDVQSTARESVLKVTDVDTIPAGRTFESLAVLIPGMTSGAQDVGGTNDLRLTANLAIHGGRIADERTMEDGITIRNIGAAGSYTNMIPDQGSSQEVVIDYSAGLAETAMGGVNINILPREGGNTFHGTFFATADDSAFQGNNYTQALQQAGLTSPNHLKLLYDVDGSAGGPLMPDKLWFFSSLRRVVNETYLAGIYANLNAGNPSSWAYAPNYSQQGSLFTIQPSANGRLTWQATPRNKISVFVDDQPRDYNTANATTSPESVSEFVLDKGLIMSAGWSSPVTNKLLLEARLSTHGEDLHNGAWPDNPDDVYRSLIAVTEQGGLIPGLLYRGAGQQNGPTFIFAVMDAPNIWEASASATYVTGAHAFKVGFLDGWGLQTLLERDIDSSTSYRFDNGVPNQITERATPVTGFDDMKAELGVYVQDKWTLKRLTLNGGLRFDYFNSYFPATPLGPGPLVPTRNFTIPQYSWYDWKDLNPRFAGSYDLFGNGKTALKASVGRYVLAGDPTQGNVFGELSDTVTRSWNPSVPPGSANYYIPQCNLLNPKANGDCGAISQSTFGTQIPSTQYDPAVLNGWYKRPYNWEISTSVQHELLPGVAVDVGYFRRIYGNFLVTDNLAVGASDFSPFSVTAPLNPGLPGGGGNVIGGLYNVNPNKVGQVNNYVTFADNFGGEKEHWNGVDMSVSARFRGLLVRGGLSVGRTMTDTCAVVTNNPQVSVVTSTLGTVQSTQMCHQQTPFIPQVKLLATYVVPRVMVNVAATFQSLPGPIIAANYVATNAIVEPSLGRPLSGGASNTTVNLVSPGAIYGERLNQTDLRFSRVIKLWGRSRVSANFDLYNLFNASAVETVNNNYAAWQVPQSILDARLFKISAQFDF
jgi:hypothetical protein